MAYVNKRPTIFFEDAEIKYRNFSGDPERSNFGSTDRTFSIIIEDEEEALDLKDKGWNVRTKVWNSGEVEYSLPVKVGFNFPPKIIVRQEGRKVRRTLTEETIDCLDSMDIISVCATVTGSRRKDDPDKLKAYVSELWVTQAISRWEEKFAEDEYPVDD